MRSLPGLTRGRVTLSVGLPQVNPKCRRCARARRARARICLRKDCGRKYQPRCWNQRYCQDPECRRQVRRWQAARRQARCRLAAEARARHAEAQRARRQRAKSAPQTPNEPEVAPARGHAAEIFIRLPVCARPGCHEPPLSSIRNPARYCCSACRQAVGNVLDRERKWRSRGRLAGRQKRAFEYQAARRQRSSRESDASGASSSRAPPQ